MPATRIRATVDGRLFGQVATRNIFHLSVTPAGAETLHVATSYWCVRLYTALQPLCTTQWTTETLTTETWQDTFWQPNETSVFTIAGTVTGQQIANLVALVLIGKVAHPKSVGRKFFSGLAENSVNGNSLDSNVVSNAATLLVDYLTSETTAAGSVVVPGIVAKNGFFYPFVGGVVSTLLGTMRRRKPGRGI